VNGYSKVRDYSSCFAGLANLFYIFPRPLARIAKPITTTARIIDEVIIRTFLFLRNPKPSRIVPIKSPNPM
jgi:hypothetical protein